MHNVSAEKEGRCVSGCNKLLLHVFVHSTKILRTFQSKLLQELLKVNDNFI